MSVRLTDLIKHVVLPWTVLVCYASSSIVRASCLSSSAIQIRSRLTLPSCMERGVPYHNVPFASLPKLTNYFSHLALLVCSHFYSNGDVVYKTRFVVWRCIWYHKYSYLVFHQLPIFFLPLSCSFDSLIAKPFRLGDAFVDQFLCLDKLGRKELLTSSGLDEFSSSSIFSTAALRSDGSRSSSFEFSEPSDARLGSNSTLLSVRSSPLQLQPWGFRRRQER